MYEAVRAGNLHNFSKDDFKILDEFWKKHIKKIYNSQGVYLYEILSAEESSRPHPIPANTVIAAYMTYKSQRGTKYIKNKQWAQALEEFNNLLDRGIYNHQIFYLIGICHYNEGDFKNSKKYANMAYKIKPKIQYKKLLERLSEPSPLNRRNTGK